MSVINTNVNAIIAQNAGVKNSRVQTQAMQQLSTGSRINSAADDAAGLAISSKMTSQIRGLNQAVRNANDGISLIQTAEGALTEVTNMLQRMRELAVQSASDTNTASDRTALNAEFTSLRDEINRIGNNTQFNGMNVLDKSFDSGSGTFVFQVGANGAQTIDITLGDYRTAAGVSSTLSVASATSGGKQSTTVTIDKTVATDEAITLKVNGSTATYIVGSADTADASLSTAEMATGTTASAVAFRSEVASALGVAVGSLTFAAVNLDSTNKTGDLKITGPDGQAFTITATATATAPTNTYSATQQTDTITFAAAVAGDVVTLNAGGSDYTYTVPTGGKTGSELATAIYNDSAFQTWATTNNVAYANPASGDTLTLTGNNSVSFTTVASATTTSAGDLNMINTSSITTQSNSNSAVTSLDSAIAVVSGGRATMGATINRLNYAADNLLATSANVSAARSRVQDTDYSQATTELARTQIIQQASTAMLAQANQSAQSVLSLLK